VVAFAGVESAVESLLALGAASDLLFGAAPGVATAASVLAAGRGLTFFGCGVDGESAVLTSARAGEAVSIGCADGLLLAGTAAAEAAVSLAGGVSDCLEQPAIPATRLSRRKRCGRRGRGVGMYISLVQSGPQSVKLRERPRRSVPVSCPTAALV
jgi:hypothetical protein